MRTVVGSLFLTVTAVFGAGVAVQVADVSGTWTLEMRWSGDTKSTGVCAFEQDGSTLRGTCGDTDKFPLSGEVRGSKLSWQFDVERDGNKGRMEFAGELKEDGAVIEGSCAVVGGQDGSFTMKKQP